MSTECTSPQVTDEFQRLDEHEWHLLQPMDRVHLRRQDKTSDSGTVDQIMAEAALFWVWLDHGKGRILVHSDSRTSVWRITAG